MKTYIINLPERTDRLAQAKAELEKYGITDYEVFPAIKHEDGKLGIYLTLYKLIEQSYFGGEEYITIFEDDILFIDPSANNLADWLKDFPIKRIGFDIFYLGCNTHDPEDGRMPLAKYYYNGMFPKSMNSESMLTVLDAYGCHAMILSRSGMFKILRAIQQQATYFILDLYPGKWHEFHKSVDDARPIDVLIQREIQPDGKCYCCNPIIATQRSGYSDIEKKEMNQDYIVDRFNENVKRLFTMLIGLILLLGCNGIKKGRVVNKYMKPAHYVTTYIKIGSVLSPITTFYPDEYIITIGDSINHNYETNEIKVTRQDYEKTAIGEKASFQ